MIPRATTSHEGQRTMGSELAEVPPHICDLGDGPRMILGACAVQVAQITTSTGLDAPSIILLHPQAAAGLTAALSIEGAEAIIASLTRIVRTMKGAANDAAAAALRKAAGK